MQKKTGAVPKSRLFLLPAKVRAKLVQRTTRNEFTQAA